MEYREFMEQVKGICRNSFSGTLERAAVTTTQVDKLQGRFL